MSNSQTNLRRKYDLLVVGGGNAALCAAITAKRERPSASVILLESSPKDVRGGNSRHTRNIRYIHPAKNSFLTGPYTEDECYQDLLGVTKGNTIEKMARLVIRESNNVGDWMMEQGVRFQPAMKGTLHLSRTNGFFLGGGKALINAYYATAEKLGVEILYEAEALDLEIVNDEFKSCTVKMEGETFRIEAKAVVLASGGYQANTEWLKNSWGPQAANFLVRGTPYDKGRMLKVMMDHGCKTLGDPTQGHMVAIDGRAPKFDGGICTRLDCVPFGVAVNKDCKRFYNEGEEIWPKRYAIWGRLVAGQPDQVAYIVIDSKAINLFMPSVFPPFEANSIEDLAGELGIDPAGLKATVDEFNAHCPSDTSKFNSGDKDGVATVEGLEPPKTNWARPIDTPPFYGYMLRPGITFSYLSLALNERMQVEKEDGGVFKNIFAAGEITSGNVLGQGYMAGFGMTIGTVFGRRAGKEAMNV